MTMLCTCGIRFKLHKIGELIIKDGNLFSIDSYRCEICSKTILGGMSPAPICEANSERATTIIERMIAREYNCYGVDV